MKTIMRILSVAVILIAALFLLVYLVAGVGLWQANQPTKTALVNTFTAVDQVLQKADPIVEKVAAISGDVARIGNEIGGEQSGLSQTATLVQDQLIVLRANVHETEQTIATVIPQIPTYINLIWIAATLVLLWLALAQAALIYLAVLYIRTGRLGQPAPVVATAPLATVEGGIRLARVQDSYAHERTDIMTNALGFSIENIDPTADPAQRFSGSKLFLDARNIERSTDLFHRSRDGGF